MRTLAILLVLASPAGAQCIAGMPVPVIARGPGPLVPSLTEDNPSENVVPHGSPGATSSICGAGVTFAFIENVGFSQQQHREACGAETF